MAPTHILATKLDRVILVRTRTHVPSEFSVRALRNLYCCRVPWSAWCQKLSRAIRGAGTRIPSTRYTAPPSPSPSPPPPPPPRFFYVRATININSNMNSDLSQSWYSSSFIHSYDGWPASTSRGPRTRRQPEARSAQHRRHFSLHWRIFPRFLASWYPGVCTSYCENTAVVVQQYRLQGLQQSMCAWHLHSAFSYMYRTYYYGGP